MKVLFLYNGSESVGIESLSAYLKSHGHDTDLVFDPALFRASRGRDSRLLSRIFDPPMEDFVEAILRAEPDVLACSCITGNYQWALKIAGEARRRSKKPIATVFGGIHPTMVPDRVIGQDAVDAVVVGEGEGAMLDLVESLENGKFTNPKTANAWVKIDGTVHKNSVRPYIRDLDSLPFPDKEMFYRKVPFFRRAHLLMTSRGCPYNCSFCCNNVFKKIYSGEKGHVRRFSVERVIDELKYFKSRGRVDCLNIFDDIFTLDKEWLEKFVPLYAREIRLPFTCNLHPHYSDDDRVKLIKEAGCVMVRLGVETLHAQTLKSILNRHGAREKVSEAIRTLKKYDVGVTIEHIMGLPLEGPEVQRDAVCFYSEHRPSKIVTFWLLPFPGTQILKTVKDMGLISDAEAEAFHEGDPRLHFSFFSPNAVGKMDNEELKRFTLLFDLLPLLPSRYIKWMLDKQIHRYIPYSVLMHQILIVIYALTFWDYEDIYALIYVFAKKYPPLPKRAGFVKSLFSKLLGNKPPAGN